MAGPGCEAHHFPNPLTQELRIETRSGGLQTAVLLVGDCKSAILGSFSRSILFGDDFV
jgi:hypothetical protein